MIVGGFGPEHGRPEAGSACRDSSMLSEYGSPWKRCS